MQGSYKVDYHELYALHDRLRSIADGLGQTDDRGDYAESAYGDRRIVDALTSFSRDWSHARANIVESVNSLKDKVWSAAHEYEKVDDSVKRSMCVDESGLTKP